MKNKIKNIALVYGTRPELLKLVPLIKILSERNDVVLTIINTGQHREMLFEIEEYFGIKANYYLDIMSPNQSLTDILVKISRAIEPILLEIKPDIVLLQGDTTTVATVGIVCFYNQIAIGHIEAGLRSFNLQEPFPEEFNRRAVSLIADFNFAPTALSAQNLKNEAVAENKIFITGNTIVDTIQLVKKTIVPVQSNKRKILVTAHRRENHENGIVHICNAVKQLLKEFDDLEFVWPVHPNPNVKTVVEEAFQQEPRVQLTQPMNYQTLSAELFSCFMVWSDSGGIQEECPSYKKPILILRNVTERPEVVTSGFGKLVGVDENEILQQARLLLNNPAEYERMVSGENPFGDGTASQQIADIILNPLS